MTLRRKVDKLQEELKSGGSTGRGSARYTVDSWEDYWRVRSSFLPLGNLPPPPPDPLPGEDDEAYFARLRREGEEARAARHRDGTRPVEERYTYEEAVGAGIIRETPSFQATYAAEVERVRAGAPSQHFPPPPPE